MDKIETAVIICTKGKKPLCLSGFWLLLFKSVNTNPSHVLCVQLP